MFDDSFVDRSGLEQAKDTLISFSCIWFCDSLGLQCLSITTEVLQWMNSTGNRKNGQTTESRASSVGDSQLLDQLLKPELNSLISDVKPLKALCCFQGQTPCLLKAWCLKATVDISTSNINNLVVKVND